MNFVKRIEGLEFDKWWPNICEQMDTITHVWERWWTKQSLYDAVVSGWSQCWGAVHEDTLEIIVFTSVVCYPAGRSLVTNLAFGNNIDDHIATIDATLEDFARTAECEWQEVRGRPGWKPRLKSLGYGDQQIQMFKAVPAGRRH